MLLLRWMFHLRLWEVGFVGFGLSVCFGGTAMEGPGLGRRGRKASLHSPGVWWVRVEKVSVWGLPVHRWRSVIMRAGGANPPPSLMGWNALMATTVESLEGPMARFPPKAGHCASPAR